MSKHSFCIKQNIKQIYEKTKNIADEKQDKITVNDLIKEIKTLVLQCTMYKSKTQKYSYDILLEIISRAVLLLCLTDDVVIGNQL